MNSQPLCQYAISMMVAVFVLACGHIFPARLPAEFQDDKKNLLESIELFDQIFNELTPKSKNAAYVLPKQIANNIIRTNQDANNLASIIDAKFFDYVDTNLKQMYRGKLIKGTQMIVDGIQQGEGPDTLMWAQGYQLVFEWRSWWRQKEIQIKRKLF